MTLKTIKNILQQFIDNMDAGNSIVTEEEEQEILKLIQKINQQELSKVESADYLGVCRATFDNYIKKGLIPKGHKRQGFKELSWNKSDLLEIKQKLQKEYGKNI